MNIADHGQSSPIVVAREVSHAYGTGKTRKEVLSGVELTLSAGEFVVLSGHSGAGKTTLLTLIGALRSLQHGHLEVLGVNLRACDAEQARSVRRRIGFIFQDHNLFDALTALQTLWLATELSDHPLTRGAAESRSLEVLGKLAMSEHLHALPRELSTGQKQRVAIARAMMNKPRLILGDEPTASLDYASSSLVITMIKQHIAESGASALIVTHDERIFAYADRVIRLEEGRMVASK